MQKINFTDTTVTQKPYVTINNQNYEVQDGIYTGGTDLNADTFNTMQSNIEQAINAIYPIGSIIIRDDAEDMSNFLGFTWEKVFAGRVLVGFDTSQTEFNTIGKTGGEKTHTLTIDEMPAHSHKLNGNTDVTFDESSTYPYLLASAKRGYADGSGVTFGEGYSINDTTTAGGGEAHNNLQPYQVVAYWKRTA